MREGRYLYHQPEQTNVNGMNIEILPYSSSQKYLGRRFTFQDPTRNEIESRIAAGWKKFCLLKHELTTKTYSIKDRLRLFHGTVTPTVLYGCSSWTLTVELKMLMIRERTTQQTHPCPNCRRISRDSQRQDYTRSHNTNPNM